MHAKRSLLSRSKLQLLLRPAPPPSRCFASSQGIYSCCLSLDHLFAACHALAVQWQLLCIRASLPPVHATEFAASGICMEWYLVLTEPFTEPELLAATVAHVVMHEDACMSPRTGHAYLLPVGLSVEIQRSVSS
jgi:hypothetical protein